MGFLSGRVSFERFKVGGRELTLFDQRHVDILDRHAMGRTGALTADGVEVGFTAGDHLLDLDFTLEKNILNDCLHAAIRIDTNKVPGDLLKAYMQMELAILSAKNPSGFPSRQQRMQAKQVAEERCDDEAKTGKFRRMKQYPFLWDLKSGVVYLASGSLTVIERFLSLFKEAFDRPLSRITSGVLAHEMAVEQGRSRAVEDVAPAVFSGPKRKQSVAWVADQHGSRDFIGNEFLVWLWWVLEVESDTLELPDGSTATVMLNKTLGLECPLAETGKETISHEAPTKLPEAKRALLAGKLPRKSGMALVRHDEPYELTLQAESLAVGSASLPKHDTEAGRAEREERVTQVRDLAESIDQVFGAFLARRLTSAWTEDLSKIRKWLEEPE